jgi:hypothetical protein
VLAFLDINPLSVGHTLVIPKYCAQRTHQLPEDVMSEVGKALQVGVFRCFCCFFFNPSDRKCRWPSSRPPKLKIITYSRTTALLPIKVCLFPPFFFLFFCF